MGCEPKSDNQSAQQKHPPSRRPLIIRILRTLQSYENRRRRRSKKEKADRDLIMARWTRRLGIFTAALVIVGIGTGFIFLRQLNVMQGQLKEAMSEQRAWVAPITAFITTPLTDPTKLGGAIVMRNFGTRAAHYQISTFSDGIDVSGIEPQSISDYINRSPESFRVKDLCLYGSKFSGESVIYPSTEAKDIANFYITKESGNGTGERLIARTENNSAVFYEYGCITYEASGAIGHSQFCFYLEPGTPVGSAGERLMKLCPVKLKQD